MTCSSTNSWFWQTLDKTKHTDLNRPALILNCWHIWSLSATTKLGAVHVPSKNYKKKSININIIVSYASFYSNQNSSFKDATLWFSCPSLLLFWPSAILSQLLIAGPEGYAGGPCAAQPASPEVLLSTQQTTAISALFQHRSPGGALQPYISALECLFLYICGTEMFGQG